MSLIFGVKYNIAKIISLFAPAVPGRRILMFHSIGKFDNYSVDINVLSSVMHKLTKLNIKIVPLEQLPSSPLNSLSITFDDGYADNFLLGLPIFQKLNTPFTVFVTSDLVKNNIDNYLTRTQLKELSNSSLCSIGSHASSHTPLASLSKETALKELIESKTFLENIIEKTVNTISYPHGLTSNEVIESTKEAGYTLACSSKWGNNKKINPYMLKRNPIFSLDNECHIVQKVVGKWDWMEKHS